MAQISASRICPAANGLGNAWSSRGAEALSNADLIAILLRTGTQGASALHIAEALLHRFDSLDRLARASLDELQQTKGIGRDKAIALQSAFTLAQRMAREIRQEAPLLDTPSGLPTCCARTTGSTESSSSKSCCSTRAAN